MRLHHPVATAGVDFHSTDARVGALTVRWADWLDADGRYRIRLGLHELLVNIRDHAYGGEDGPIDVLFTASDDSFRVDVTDWGRRFEGPVTRPLPGQPATGGYGLPIVAAVFDEVTHRRISGRNWWVLEVRRPEGPCR